MTMPMPPEQGPPMGAPPGQMKLGMSDLAQAAMRKLGGPAGVPSAGRGGVLPGGMGGGPEAGGLPPQLVQLLMQLMGPQ